MRRASSALKESAPYEFYMAREHLEKAKLEAAEADYGDAARLSEAAEGFAERAIELTRHAHGWGPPMRAALVWLPSLVSLACTRAPALSGRIAALEAIVGQAAQNGAVRCAPRELATAQSQLEFATLELAQGFASKAQRHFDRAEPNAHAALFLSPPQYCAQQRIAEGAPADPDTDGDGLRDAADQCVLEAEDRDQYLDKDGCPEADNDLDGVLDVADQCPLAAEDPDGYQDDDGCIDPDNDGDSVLDAQDLCPSEPGSATEAPRLGCAVDP